jgi:hypothetical protein
MFALRRELEGAVTAQGRDVGVYHSALIQSACRHETRAQLLQRYLRESPDLTLAERCQLLDGIGRATDARDKCLDRMGLSAAPVPLDFATILATAHTAAAEPEPRQAAPVATPREPTPPADPQADPTATDAPAGHHARHDGSAAA